MRAETYETLCLAVGHVAVPVVFLVSLFYVVRAAFDRRRP